MDCKITYLPSTPSLSIAGLSKPASHTHFHRVPPLSPLHTHLPGPPLPPFLSSGCVVHQSFHSTLPQLLPSLWPPPPTTCIPQLADPLKVIDVLHSLLHHLVHHVSSMHFNHNKCRHDGSLHLLQLAPHQRHQVIELEGQKCVNWNSGVPLCMERCCQVHIGENYD